jgi:hypothetical protein
LGAAAAKGHDGEGDDEISGDESWDRPVVSGPRKVQAFADPEGSEGREQDADGEFEGVFGDSGQWAVQDEAESDDDEEGGDGSQTGWEKHSGVASSDCDDDEDDLCAFEHGDVESGCEGDVVPCSGAAAEAVHGFGVFLERGLLVVERDLAGGAEDGFAQPAEAE